MNVDRARFLFLTTALSAATAVALSAAGCSASDTKETSSSGNVPPVDSGGTVDSGTDAYTNPDAEEAGACLGDDGVDPTCEGVLVTDCQAPCANYLTNFKKGVGRAIVECIAGLTACTGAEDPAIYACVQGALGKACADPTASTFCDPLADLCNADGGAAGDAGMPPLDKGECADLAKGLSTAGRAAFKTCVTDDQANYCQDDPASCIDLIQ